MTSTEVDNIIKGLYTPSSYQASVVINNPNLISAELVSRISPDSLKSYLFTLKSFQNRNAGSDTVSTTRGIGAARRWAYSKFLEFSAANENRLRAAYLQFDLNICGAARHRNAIAVLPGTQTTDKSVIFLQGHIDSRCEALCDITCNAFGIEDNATGTALVLELARVMSKYSFKNTIVFSINTAEEQGKYGAQAMANYFLNNNLKIKAANNNDVSGGVFCGHTSSPPSCPFFGNIDSIGLRIFSLGGFNSVHKQWARYIKLQYKEQVKSVVSVATNIQIMSAEDRTGRGGDHQPFSAYGYTSVRFTAANENGDASGGGGYIDRQHSVRDSLGKDLDSDGIEDSLYVSQYYLARNTLINGNAMAMAALSPDTINLTTSVVTSNKIRVQFNSGTTYPAYRVAVRCLNDDWDSVFTVTGKTVDTIKVPYGSNATFFISAASVDNNNLESFFSTEYSLSLQQVTLALRESPARRSRAEEIYGIKLLQNQPNPFDENTRITIVSGTDLFIDRTWVVISQQDGRIVKRIKVALKKGINEVPYNHGYGASGSCIYSLIIDGLPVQSKKMIFGKL
ncbi:MAG: M28 family peptidase [Chitinophagaceae bacterium]